MKLLLECPPSPRSPDRYAPRILGHNIPELERPQAQHVQAMLDRLWSFTNTFDATIKLMVHCRQNSDLLLVQKDQARQQQQYDRSRQLMDSMKLLSDWVTIAARDGTLTIYHFGKTLKAINFKHAPTIALHVDHKLLRAARSTFDQRFPENIEARNAVGHAADRHATADKSGETTYKGGLDSPDLHVAPGAGVVITNALIGSSMTATHIDPHTRQTSVVSADISADTLADLVMIQEQAFAAFRPLEQFVRSRVSSDAG